MKNVTLLAIAQALASSLTIPLEMLSAADVINRTRNRCRESQLKLLVAAASTRTMSLNGGFRIVPDVALRDIAQAELIFIPALWGNPRATVNKNPEVVSWLAEQYQQGATICSVGTGSYFLAEAGLLQNRSATTHWRFFEDFQHSYPDVKLQRRRFITHEDRLYCTGSVNAVRDVMLHFVEQLFNSEVADEVAHHFTHELKRSYESMLLAEEQKNSHHDELIIKIQEWLQSNYQSDFRLSALATRFGLNVRSFNRRFRQAAGKTPLQYLQELRISQAKELLKHSNLSIAEIAFAVGYQDVSYFTGLFRRVNSVTPNEYRHLVRTKLFNVNR